MTRFRTFRIRQNSLACSEEGSAPVSFLMTSLLVLIVFVGLLQTGLVMHCKNALTDVASEAARQGSRRGADNDDARQFALTQGSEVASVLSVDTTRSDLGQGELLSVTISAKYPLLGSFFTASQLSVTGRSVIEAP